MIANQNIKFKNSRQLTLDEYSIIYNIKKEKDSITPDMLYYLLNEKNYTKYILNKLLELYKDDKLYSEYRNIINLLSQKKYMNLPRIDLDID